MASLGIATYNVRGLGNNKKRGEIFYYLNNKPFQVIFLHETHSSSKTINRWRLEWGGDIFCSHGKTNSKGVAIMLKRVAGVKVLSQKCDKFGRYIRLKCKINNARYLLAIVYGPNTDNLMFFSSFTEDLDAMEVDMKIIAGDFNLVLNPELDKRGDLVATHENAEEILQSYMDQNNLLDIWRECNPDILKFTWKRLLPSPIFCRLDFILISD